MGVEVTEIVQLQNRIEQQPNYMHTLPQAEEHKDKRIGIFTRTELYLYKSIEEETDTEMSHSANTRQAREMEQGQEVKALFIDTNTFTEQDQALDLENVEAGVCNEKTI